MTQQEKIAHLREFYPQLRDDLVIPGSLFLDGERLLALPDGLTIKGSLFLDSCEQLQSLSNGITIKRSLYLHDCEQLHSLSHGIAIGGSFDLHGCPELREIPNSLTIGDRFNISGCMGLANAVYGCGINSRTICAYRQPSGKVVVSLDYFVGDEAESIAAIEKKYTGAAAADCIAKVRLAFKLFHQNERVLPESE